MQKRDFVLGGAAALSAVTATGIPTFTQAASRAKTIKQEVDGVKRSWSYKKLRDPTGNAPTRRVERFEIRNGDCKGGDCQKGNGRTERHVVSDLTLGDTGRFAYSIYYPSHEYNFLPNVVTNTGQVFLYDKPRSDWGGGPLWMCEASPGGAKLAAKISTFRYVGKRIYADTKRRYPLGTVGRSLPMDRWHQIVVDFKLSDGSDGFVATYVNGKRAMRYTGPTALPGAVAGMSYGLYQNRTNEYPGDKKSIPPQVVYYSGTQLLRL